MVKRWFSADLHLLHANIVRHCGRPTTPEEHDEWLIDRWNSMVGPNDEAHFLGDLAMGKTEQALALLPRLNGRLIMYPGNHDACWAGNRKGWRSKAQRYLDAGVAEIRQGTHQLTLGRFPVNVCHFPYELDLRHAGRYVDHLPRDDGRWLLHGHVHQEWKVKGRQINVGVDVWDYRPCDEDDLIELMDFGNHG